MKVGAGGNQFREKLDALVYGVRPAHHTAFGQQVIPVVELDTDRQRKGLSQNLHAVGMELPNQNGGDVSAAGKQRAELIVFANDKGGGPGDRLIDYLSHFPGSTPQFCRGCLKIQTTRLDAGGKGQKKDILF